MNKSIYKALMCHAEIVGGRHEEHPAFNPLWPH